MKKLLVVAYRNNDLFEKYVPAILSQVPAEIKIEKIIYPADTEKEVIAQKLSSEFQKIEEPFYFLSDETCGSFDWHKELKPPKKEGDVEVLMTLDYIFHEIVKEKIVGGKSFATDMDHFQSVVDRIIEILFPDQKPSKFIVVTDCIADHTTGPLRESQLNDRRLSALIVAELEYMFPKSNILKVGSVTQIEKTNLCDDTVVIVVDRHHKTFQNTNYWSQATWKHKAKLFMLPFENTLAHLKELGKIQVIFEEKDLLNRIDLKDEKT